MTETRLREAARHVARAKTVIAQQRQIIENLKAAGADTFVAEEMLQIFLGNLKIFEAHERELKERLRVSTTTSRAT
jgi:ERCC4-type nuclease